MLLQKEVCRCTLSSRAETWRLLVLGDRSLAYKAVGRTLFLLRLFFAGCGLALLISTAVLAKTF